MAKRIHTIIVKHEDEYHICYRRGEGYNALIDAPYFSAISLGWFDSQTAAQVAIDEYVFCALTKGGK